ncbi:MAG: hypothetical protein HZA16_04565 [Nitrospirae bacterium]|nr:hypothetical protein [Nitrospirota bacterium]
MKPRETATKGLYIGIGTGVVLFVIAGLLPGSLIGGVIGLKIIQAVTGAPLGGALLPRIALAVSMLAGIAVSAVAYITVPGLIGWTIGYFIDSARIAAEAKKEEIVAEHRDKQ